MTRVRYGAGGECNEPFPVEKGVWQRCVLTPFLFRLILNEVADYLLEEPLNVPTIAGRRVPILLITDDAVLMERTDIATQRLLNCFLDCCDKKLLTINSSKMKDMDLRPFPGFKWKHLNDGESFETFKHLDYLGIWSAENLHWGSHVRKATIILKQLAGAVLKYRHKGGVRSISIILQIYTQKAVAAALYGAELCGYVTTSPQQMAEKNILRVLQRLGPGAPLISLYMERGITPISETVALRSVLYCVKLVCNPKAVVYLITLEEATLNGGGGGCLCVSHGTKVLKELQLEALWAEPCRVKQDTVDQIKDRYHEYKLTRACLVLTPGPIL
ncbi:hypothetical protein NDU88_006513 [Pleurodeles waltl]|uniref:Reverse transcriptase domain-containing protein n=1 Tax=Pleurodeles waltl TaxID=8319 RepID=A0AAV7PMN0_PLEWA|nr:hypothetical protein NDU88_006513 [Pleurodeles waltl]